MEIMARETIVIHISFTNTLSVSRSAPIPVVDPSVRGNSTVRVRAGEGNATFFVLKGGAEPPHLFAQGLIGPRSVPLGLPTCPGMSWRES